ncbi:MAG: copper amine oxidase N-terminal domain-containing protein, partial [Defluviitaleaceae bacterium]|nr:copper amine oxidase N-terminal domain-containing protein [Defluviitaleaceae bacterium]
TGSNGDGDTGSNGDGDTGSNGDGDTGSNGDGDTGSNGDGDTGSNGSGDSGSNGSGDSGSNGSGDSGSNGSGDSGSNGSGNRRPSPPPTASSASVLSGQSDETTGIFAFSPHISSAELPMRTLRELSSLGQDIALTLGDMTITIPARALSDNAPVYAQSAAVSISSVPYRSVAPLNSAYRSGSLSSSNISLLFEMDLSVDAQQIAHLESPVEVRITYENLTSDQLSVFVISDTGRLNQIGGVLRESSGEISFTADELGTFAVIRNSQLSTMSLAVGGYSYSVDGSLRTTDAAPIILNDRSLVPLRIIAEATGSRVDWSHEDRAVTISRYNRELRLFVDMLTPGLDTPAVIVNDRTMVPLRFIAESFGSSVVWDDAAQTITIYHLSDIQSPD